MQLGNGRWESTQFNSRLQPTQIALGSVKNGTDKLKLNYEYGALDLGTGQTIAATNNGNVSKQTITVGAVGVTPGFTAVQNYDYDSLNRIQIASETLTPTTGTPEYWVQESSMTATVTVHSRNRRRQLFRKSAMAVRKYVQRFALSLIHRPIRLTIS